MPHMPHRQLAANSPTPANPVDRVLSAGIERHMGTTRAPRPRVLKPPIG